MCSSPLLVSRTSEARPSAGSVVRLDDVLVLELLDLPAHGRGVELDLRGEVGHAHGVLAHQRPHERERRRVDLVLGVPGAQLAARLHEQADHRLLSRGRVLGHVDIRLHDASIYLDACAMQPLEVGPLPADSSRWANVEDPQIR